MGTGRGASKQNGTRFIPGLSTREYYTDIVMPVNILALPIAQSRFLRVVSKTGRRQPTRKGDLEFMQDQSATSKPWLHGKTMRQQ